MQNLTVNVSVIPSYLAEQSDGDTYRFIWAYEVSIHNKSTQAIQLLNRYWQITSMSGEVNVVKGAGVVGLQPLILPNKHFAYTSFCELNAPQGTMEGHYEMQTLDETHFQVPIPKFILTSPSSMSTVFRSHLH